MARTIVCSSWPIFASFPNDLASVCGLSCLGDLYVVMVYINTEFISTTSLESIFILEYGFAIRAFLDVQQDKDYLL